MTRSQSLSSTALAHTLPNAVDPTKLRLQLEYLPVSSLKPYARHARVHSEKKKAILSANIKEQGIINPLLIDEDGVIVDGVARWEIAQELGIDPVPVIVLPHLSRQQIRRVRLTVNRLAELAEWDMQTLAFELRDIISIEPESMPMLGWEPPQIDFMISQLNPTPEDDPADAVDWKPAEPVSRSGDLWRLDHHRMLCASSLEPESWVRLTGGKTAGMAFVDGPYNVKIAGNVSGTGKHAEFAMASGEMTGMEFLHFNTTWLAQVKAHVRDGAIIFACIDWRHDSELQTAGRNVGLDLLNICVWDKQVGGQGSLWRSQYELVLVFKTGKARHTNNIMLGKHGRNRSNIWSYPGANSFGSAREELDSHPTPKPVQLVADAILDVSQRGEIVLDAFLGSGTTILAAERTGRVGYGIEIEPGYIDVGIQRWQKMTNRKAMLDATGETFAEVKARRAIEAQIIQPAAYAHINPRPRRQPLAA